MKSRNWIRNILWFVVGVIATASTIFIITNISQENGLFLLLNSIVNWFSSTYGMFQSFGAVATTISIIWLIKQATTSKREYEYNCEWQEKSKAIELADFYRINVINRLSNVEPPLRITGIFDKLPKVKHDEMDAFTQDELIRLTGMDFSWRTILEQENDTSTKELLSLTYIEIEQLLNVLEYFSMYLVTGVADESVVYQSLHQTFFRIVRMLYSWIAGMNKNPKDKYYTNIIALYKTWNEKERESEVVQNAIPKSAIKINK